MQSAEFFLLPEKYLPVYIRDTRDIYEHRAVLKQLLLDNNVINYLLDILIKAIEGGTRFRTLDCLRVIKAILRNNLLGHKLDSQTVGNLFYLYKTFIFHNNEEVKMCANSLIRFQQLDDKSVRWLISHWDKSGHSLNRLLRYPEKHPLISEWAKDIYQQGQLMERQSEVIALLIDENIPAFVKEKDATIIWAIYYSRISDEAKQRLLMERFSVDFLDTLWEVSLRLGFPSVIEFMKARFLNNQNEK